MAFSTSLVLDVRQAGSDSNGGGFDPGAIVTYNTDLTATVATSSSPVVASATFNFTSIQVNQWLYLPGNGNWVGGWYQIISVASNKATLNATIGQWVTITGQPGPTTGCATTASPTVGSWTVDYSQASTSILSPITDAVIAATTTKATSVLTPFDFSMLGNVYNITSGTGFTVQRAVIVAVTLAVSVYTAQFDRTLGTAASTGGTGQGGGALANPGKAGQVSGATLAVIYIQQSATAYQITNTTLNTANGPLHVTANGGFITGWSTNRNHNNNDTPPTIQAGSSLGSVANGIIECTGVGNRVYNITIDSNSRTAIAFYGNLTTFQNCIAKNVFNTAAFFIAAASFAINCQVLTSTTGTGNPGFYLSNSACYDCVVIGNDGLAFSAIASSSASSCIHCMAINCTGHSADHGFNQITLCVNCEAYGCQGNGFFSSTYLMTCINCYAEGNTGFGFYEVTSPNALIMINCGAYNNTAGNITVTINEEPLINNNYQSLTGSAYISTSGLNFAKNSTAGAGALLRGTGYPTAIAGLSNTLTYPDIGATQHQASAASNPPGMMTLTGGING
jgi:hypothetical protein